MDNHAQRIAIAESIGWHVIDSPLNRDYIRLIDHRGNVQASELRCADSDARIRRVIMLRTPDYLNDLNAMHEVEKTLSLMQRGDYYSNLWCVCGGKAQRTASVDRWLVPTATAAQRAEAYLKTIGKWVNEDTTCIEKI